MPGGLNRHDAEITTPLQARRPGFPHVICAVDITLLLLQMMRYLHRAPSFPSSGVPNFKCFLLLISNEQISRITALEPLINDKNIKQAMTISIM